MSDMDLGKTIRSGACLLALASGCAAQGAPAESGEPGPGSRPSGAITSPPPPLVDPNLRVVVPTDERPVVTAAKPPAPISGGTLLVTRDGLRAVAADPDLDRVLIVDLTTRTLTHTIALEPGDEPGRLAEGDQGQVHVALRRGGAVASIDLAAGTLVARRSVCGAPRGLAFDAQNGALLVGCADGALVTLPADGTPTRTEVGVDARDVVVKAGRTFVSRFKRADIMEVTAGVAQPTVRAPTHYVSVRDPLGSVTIDALEPNQAWRMIDDGAGAGMLMLHQGARMGDIDIGEDDETGEVPVQSSYGGGGDCSGVVQTEITPISENGVVAGSTRLQAVLAVDLAVDSARQWVAVAQAGAQDPEQPQRVFESGGVTTGQGGSGAAGGVAIAPLALPSARGMGPFGFGQSSDVQVFFRGDMNTVTAPPESAEPPCMFPAMSFDVTGQATAVAFAPSNQLLIQTREPASLVFMNLNSNVQDAQLTFASESTFDTGHELFHRDAGAGIACASCHGEGGEDGHVWRFTGVGPRRTQALHVGLEGTAPFHWEGDLADISTLMEDVLVGRMGGVHEGVGRVAALEQWLFSLKAPAPIRAADDAAAVRGHALFEGAAECGTCHTGAKLTNNKTVDVGTGAPLQVPSLVGIAYRAPFVHTGCADTLQDRFDPECGGAAHGKVADLSAAEIDDLVAYLETL